VDGPGDSSAWGCKAYDQPQGSGHWRGAPKSYRHQSSRAVPARNTQVPTLARCSALELLLLTPPLPPLASGALLLSLFSPPSICCLGFNLVHEFLRLEIAVALHSFIPPGPSCSRPSIVLPFHDRPQHPHLVIDDGAGLTRSSTTRHLP